MVGQQSMQLKHVAHEDMNMTFIPANIGGVANVMLKPLNNIITVLSMIAFYRKPRRIIIKIVNVFRNNERIAGSIEVINK